MHGLTVRQKDNPKVWPSFSSILAQRPVAIPNVGGMNHGGKLQTKRIDRDTAFVTVDLLSSPKSCRAFHALTIDDGNGWTGGTASLFSTQDVEFMMKTQ